MNILDFEKWSAAVNEGFDAKIEDDEDTKDEIEIEAPNKDNTIKYIINGDDVKIKEQTKDGDTKESNILTKNIEDEQLKDDIIDAVESINDIKDIERAKEIRRLTGDEKSSIKKEIISILDNKKSNEIRRKHEKNGQTIIYSLRNAVDEKCENFWGEEGSGKYVYLDISNIEGENGKIETKRMFNVKKGSVGRGEYLLPLLFTDVYKQKVYSIDELSRGDNFILKNESNPITNDNKFHLELKSSNASLKLDDDFKKHMRFSNGSYKKYNSSKYKNAIITSFLEYIYKQSKYRKDLYICIFNIKNEIPKGMLIINVTSKNDDIYNENSEIFKTFSKLIFINRKEKSPNKDFSYTFGVKNNKPRIICSLHSDYLTESLILSRDNFINEYFTK